MKCLLHKCDDLKLSSLHPYKRSWIWKQTVTLVLDGAQRYFGGVRDCWPASRANQLVSLARTSSSEFYMKHPVSEYGGGENS